MRAQGEDLGPMNEQEIKARRSQLRVYRGIIGCILAYAFYRKLRRWMFGEAVELGISSAAAAAITGGVGASSASSSGFKQLAAEKDLEDVFQAGLAGTGVGFGKRGVVAGASQRPTAAAAISALGAAGAAGAASGAAAAGSGAGAGALTGASAAAQAKPPPSLGLDEIW